MGKKAKTVLEQPIEPEHSIKEFVENMVDESPEPSPEAIASMAVSGEVKETNDNVLPISTIKDASGATFDPSIHAAKATGEASFAANGNFRRKRGTGQSKVAGARVSKQIVITDEQEKQKARVTGVACAEIMFKTAVMLGGDDWYPLKNDEHQIDERRDMQQAFADYCEAKQISDLPPGVMLTVVLSAYALPRFSSPETQKRASSFGLWLKTKWLAVSHWRKTRAARNDNRDDGKRKDDVSKADSSDAKTTGPRNAST